MEIRILVFGVAKDIMGNSSITISLEPGMSTQQLRSILEEKYPRLKQLSSYMLAVNSEYASGNELISDRDEIAIIPPVSGG